MRVFSVVLLVAVAACDIRPLTSAELYGAVDAAIERPPPPPTEAGVAEALPDVPDASEPDGDGGAEPEVAPAPCAGGCAADQFCDEVAGRCAPRRGRGMLGGAVIDVCTGRGLDALVGIAGRHTCSFWDKGSYFFPELPLGTLKLAAVRDGYELSGETIQIDADGGVHDIRLMRVGGCAAPAPVRGACTCTAPTCEP